mmetsp:Transcript_26335/g.71126  ORF Transcript_26335/g.71126 Transcript_26335/m.71126 type:complete len:248 (-) Transcript_26335:1099-1842(-)
MSLTCALAPRRSARATAAARRAAAAGGSPLQSRRPWLALSGRGLSACPCASKSGASSCCSPSGTSPAPLDPGASFAAPGPAHTARKPLSPWLKGPGTSAKPAWSAVGSRPASKDSVEQTTSSWSGVQRAWSRAPRAARAHARTWDGQSAHGEARRESAAQCRAPSARWWETEGSFQASSSASLTRRARRERWLARHRSSAHAEARSGPRAAERVSAEAICSVQKVTSAQRRRGRKAMAPEESVWEGA